MEPSANFFRLSSPELPMQVTYRVYQTSTPPSRKPGFTYVARYFSVLLVYRGEVLTSISGKPLLLSPGDIRVFLQDDLHLFQSVSMDTRYVQISLSANLFGFPKEHFFYQRFVGPLANKELDCPRLFRPGDEGYDGLYQQMHRLDNTREGQDSYTAELSAIATSLCTALLPYCRTGKPASYPTEDAVRACLKYMSVHGSEKVTLEQLAEVTHMHPNYLCTVFKNYTGKTVFDHLTRQRLRRASRQLRSTRHPIQQIAEASGFPSLSFFNRKFRKIYGYTPQPVPQKICQPLPWGGGRIKYSRRSNQCTCGCSIYNPKSPMATARMAITISV